MCIELCGGAELLHLLPASQLWVPMLLGRLLHSYCAAINAAHTNSTQWLSGGTHGFGSRAGQERASQTCRSEQGLGQEEAPEPSRALPMPW